MTVNRLYDVVECLRGREWKHIGRFDDYAKKDFLDDTEFRKRHGKYYPPIVLWFPVAY